MQEKYLPIGTVVLLKGGSKRVMITGFCSVDGSKSDVIYDYNGCLYPEGYLSNDQTCLFNHDQIAKIYHMGFIDEEEKEFKARLKELVASLKENSSAKVESLKEKEDK